MLFFLKGSGTLIMFNDFHWIFVLNKRQFWHNCNQGVWGIKKIFIKISFILELCLYTFGFSSSIVEFILLYFFPSRGDLSFISESAMAFWTLARNYNNEKSMLTHFYEEKKIFYNANMQLCNFTSLEIIIKVSEKNVSRSNLFICLLYCGI